MNQILTNMLMDGRKETCVDCRDEFIFMPIIYAGREMFAGCEKLCDSCIARREKKKTEEEERIRELAERQGQDRKWEAICPILYRRTDPARLPQDKLRKVMEWQYNPRGLIFHGFTGRYKTRAAYLLLRRLHYEGIKIAAFDSTDFANKCADKFRDGSGGVWIESLIRIPIFFIDDLGNEPSGERGAGEIFHIIKRRGEEMLPVIITTNTVGGELSTKLRGPQDRGYSLVRRLREFCEPIEF